MVSIEASVSKGWLHKNGGFNFDTLVKSSDKEDNLDIDSIYYRANLEPTEQYVLAEKKTSKHRIKANETGYTNLVITGDWIDNGWIGL